VDGRAFAAPKGLRPRRRDKPGHDELHVTVYILAPVGYFVLPRFDHPLPQRLTASLLVTAFIISHRTVPAIPRHAEIRA
jgi:hypothetical protein